MKKYISKSEIAFNVLIDGKRRHVSFNPLTKGGSEFKTSDAKLQEALEGSTLFGKDYTLSEEVVESEENNEGGEDDTVLVDVEDITSAADAKSFLIEKGISEDLLKTKPSIKKAAKSLGFKFSNLK